MWPDFDRWPGLLLAVSVCGVAVVWMSTARLVVRQNWSTTTVWWVGAAWTTPLVLGPPALSNDVFSYVAQGAVATTGADPTRISAMALGWHSPLLQAVDPLWRQTTSPYGPLATLLQREAVDAAGGHAVLAIVLLRLVALVSVAGIAALAVSISHTRPGHRPPSAAIVLLTWANPLLTLHVVAAVHLEGVLVLLVLAAVRTVMTRTAVGDAAALAAAAGAAAVKLPVGAVAVAVVVVVVVLRGTTVPTRIRRAVVAAALPVGGYALLCVLAGSGWNVAAVLAAPAAGRTPAAPATWLATVLAPLPWWGAAHQAESDAVGRAVVAGAAVLVIAGLVLTAGRRRPAVTLGLALLTLAAGSPVLYPWYLVWSVPLLAAVATGAWQRRLVWLSALGAVMTVQGLTHLETWILACTVLTTAAVGVVLSEPGLRRRALRPLRRPAAAGATGSVTS